MKRAAPWVVGALVALGVIVLAIDFATVQHWVSHTTGTDKGSGVFYAFWSGFGSDLGEATLIATVGVGVYTGVRRVNCHTKGCWRIAHHPLEGTPYHLCQHHHPDVPEGGATHEQILASHAHFLEHRSAREGLGAAAAPDSQVPGATSPPS